MINLVRAARSPDELAREFEPTAQSICAWVATRRQAGGTPGGGASGPGHRRARRAGALAAHEVRQLRVEREILSKAAAWFALSDRDAPLRVFWFMSANQACIPVATMARVLGVSKAGFYAWMRRPPLDHAAADAALLKRVRTVHATQAPDLRGAPRFHAKLAKHKASGMAASASPG